MWSKGWLGSGVSQPDPASPVKPRPHLYMEAEQIEQSFEPSWGDPRPPAGNFAPHAWRTLEEEHELWSTQPSQLSADRLQHFVRRDDVMRFYHQTTGMPYATTDREGLNPESVLWRHRIAEEGRAQERKKGPENGSPIRMHRADSPTHSGLYDEIPYWQRPEAAKPSRRSVSASPPKSRAEKQREREAGGWWMKILGAPSQPKRPSAPPAKRIIMERMEAKGQFPKERLPSTRPTALSMRAGTQDSSYREDGRESPIERLTQERMKAERKISDSFDIRSRSPELAVPHSPPKIISGSPPKMGMNGSPTKGGSPDKYFQAISKKTPSKPPPPRTAEEIASTGAAAKAYVAETMSRIPPPSVGYAPPVYKGPGRTEYSPTKKATPPTTPPTNASPSPTKASSPMKASKPSPSPTKASSPTKAASPTKASSSPTKVVKPSPTKATASAAVHMAKYAPVPAPTPAKSPSPTKSSPTKSPTKQPVRVEAAATTSDTAPLLNSGAPASAPAPAPSTSYKDAVNGVGVKRRPVPAQPHHVKRPTAKAGCFEFFFGFILHQNKTYDDDELTTSGEEPSDARLRAYDLLEITKSKKGAASKKGAGNGGGFCQCLPCCAPK